MKKFTEVDLPQRTYGDILKENIYQIIKENVKIETSSEDEQDINITILDDIVDKIHSLIQKERIDERIQVLEEYRNNIYSWGLDLKKINEQIEDLKKIK